LESGDGFRCNYYSLAVQMKVYTDGSVIGKKGGWAFVAGSKVTSGHAKINDTYDMELMAIAEAHKLKKFDREIIWACGNRIPKATSKRHVDVTIVLRKGQRALDPDNYLKSLNDSLVNVGLLKDDNRQWLSASPIGFDRMADWGTRIRLTDI